MVPAYTPDWSEAARDEQLLDAMGAYFYPVSGEAQIGDVLVFRLRSVWSPCWGRIIGLIELRRPERGVCLVCVSRRVFIRPGFGICL